MMRRPARVAAVALSTFAAAGFAAGLSAGPAAASSGPPAVSTGCQGIQCWEQLGVKITSNGQPVTGTPNSGYALASVPPPPCWYTSFNTAAGMKQFVDQQMQSPGAAADDVPQTLAPIEPAVNKEAKADNGKGAAGEWYTLTEPTPPAQDSLSCIEHAEGAIGENYYIWVPAGQPVPQPHIPEKDLALFALSQMTLPSPNITINPAGRTFVSLPTYVKAEVPRDVAITAQLGNEQVTVTAAATGLAISAPQPQAYENGQNGNCLPQGSTAKRATINKAGPGQTPDCGFVFQAPTIGSIAITAEETWHATWAGDGFANQPVAQQPVPTAANPQPTIAVDEIQSVNNG
jgi:hypothetical protein